MSAVEVGVPPGVQFGGAPQRLPGPDMGGARAGMVHEEHRGVVRKLELVAYDDGSAAAALRLYEKLITQDRVDAILGPYRSDIVEAVADVGEKHKMPMVSPSGTATSILQERTEVRLRSLRPPAPDRRKRGGRGRPRARLPARPRRIERSRAAHATGNSRRATVNAARWCLTIVHDFRSALVGGDGGDHLLG